MDLVNLPELVKNVGLVVLSLWWLWLPLFLFVFFFQTWLYYIRRKWWTSIEWSLLEIKPPREIEQSPKITEAIFAALWAIQGTVSTKVDKYIKGVLQHYISFEIIGRHGQIHFFVRTPTIFRGFVEAKIYAEYPKAEISSAQDYVGDLPFGVLDKDWDLWGTVLQLAKPNPYPIKTYEEFIDVVPIKQPFIDPISNLLEVLNKLRPGEQAWIQIFIRPAGDDWLAEGKKEVDKLIGKPAAKKSNIIFDEFKGWIPAAGAVISELISGKAAELGAEVKKEKEEMPSKMQYLSPGDKDVVAAVEKKISKRAYETKINLLYFGKKDLFFKPTVSALNGFFGQFATTNMNAFKPNARFTTKAYYLFAERRLAFKKRIMLRLCQQRSFSEKGFVLNPEELASVWHFPTIVVQAPMAPVVEAKKGTPPPELPVA
jgi:hypothetical protein